MQLGGDTNGQFTLSLSERLERLSDLREKGCIFRVHNQLRQQNSKAYEPEILSIGPYHHNKENVIMMEDHKLHYLFLLFQHNNNKLAKFRDAVKPLVTRVRHSYAEPISLSDEQLVDMMVLDGCFVVELIRKFGDISLREEGDPIFEVDWILISLQHDLMLFENQLPFFIIRLLFEMIDGSNEERLIELLKAFFCDLLPDLKHRWNTNASAKHSSYEKVKHLLDFIHLYWSPNFAGSKKTRKSHDQNWNNRGDLTFIRCVTNLREAGIRFEKKEGNNPFDISFKKGTLHIPPLIIKDRTESFLRNLIAFEQYSETSIHVYVIEYVKFLDCLIESTKDVERLRRYGIIDNWLGDDEGVSKIFNKITDAVIFPPCEIYAEIFKRVNDYCNKPWNRRIAKLRHNYLNSPWGVISILAATILLLLTLTQTIFTILPGK